MTNIQEAKQILEREEQRKQAEKVEQEKITHARLTLAQDEALKKRNHDLAELEKYKKQLQVANAQTQGIEQNLFDCAEAFIKAVAERMEHTKDLISLTKEIEKLCKQIHEPLPQGLTYDECLFGREVFGVGGFVNLYLRRFFNEGHTVKTIDCLSPFYE